MKRKFLAKILAASMVITAAPAMPGMEVNAEELSIGSQTGGGYLDLTGSSRAADGDTAEIESELTCESFWGVHSKGVEITEDETTITFKSVTNQSAEGNHNTPIIVGYSGTENKVNGAGYKEYVVIRSDNWAWNGRGADEGNKNKEAWKNDGYNMTSNIDNTGIDWASWLATNKSGVDCTIKATRTATGASIEFTNSTVTSTTTFPVTENAPFYISLSGEQCKLSEIKVNGIPGTPPEEPDNPSEPDTPGNPSEPDTPDNPSEPGNPGSIFDKTYDCEGFWATFTDGMEVTTDGMEVSFKSRSKASASNNWNTPCVIAYSGTENKVGGSGYKEYAVIRSDAWAWGPEGVGDITTPTWESSGYKFTSEFADNFADWATWLAANKSDSGVDCKISAIKGDGKVTITFTNHTVKSVTEIPYTGDEKFYISVSGELCVFGNELPSAEKPKPLAPYPVVLPTPEPVPTLPPADENGEGIEMDFAGFWSAHLPGVEITEGGTALTYKNETHSSATGNYQVPFIVVYAGDEAKVNGAGYDEYAVIRADSYAWTTKGADANTGEGLASWNNAGFTFQTNATADTWNSWVTDNKSGLEGKVQAVKSNGKIYVEFTNGSVKTLTSFAAPEGKTVYFSLAGEECKISNIKPAAYTAIDGITPDSPAPSADPSASPDPSATAEPGSTEAPGTTDPTDPGTTPGEKDPGTTDPGTNNPAEDPSDDDDKKDKETKKTMKVSGITAKAGKKKVTGKLSVKGTKVTVKVGNKSYKNAKVNGKKFTFTASSKLKKGTKVTIKVTKSGYKTVTKTVKVK